MIAGRINFSERTSSAAAAARRVTRHIPIQHAFPFDLGQRLAAPQAAAPISAQRKRYMSPPSRVCCDNRHTTGMFNAEMQF